MDALKRRVLYSLLALVLAKAVFIFIPVPILWGINLWEYFPKPAAIAVTILCLVSIIWGLGSSQPSTRTVPPRQLSSQNFSLILFCFAALCGVFFASVTVAWPFLGDGSVFAGYLFNFQGYGKMSVWRTEAPTMYSLYGIYYLKELLTGSSTIFYPFVVLGTVSGVLFVITAIRFARSFGSGVWMRAMIIGMLIAAGGTIFFFGYIENYPLQYAFVLLYCYSAYRYLQNKTGILLPTMLLAVCIALHLQNLLLLPSLLLLWSLRNSEHRQADDKQRFVKKIILVSVPAMIVLYVYSQLYPVASSLTAPGNPFISAFPSEGFKYSLFSSQHLIDIVNEHLLIAAIPVVILISLVLTKTKIKWQDPFLLFLAVNLFYHEAFLIGGNVLFGMARDWDVFASLGITLALMVAVIFKDQSKRYSLRFAIPVLVVAFSTAVVWVTVNTSTAAATKRYEDILDIYTPKIEKLNALFGYENIRKYYWGVNKDAEIRIERKMTELLPRPTEVAYAISAASDHGKLFSPEAIDDLQAIVTTLGSIKEDSILSKEYFNGIRLGKGHDAQSTTLGEFFEDGIVLLYDEFQKISLTEALERTDRFISAHRNSAYGYELRGRLMLKYAKQIEESVPYFLRSAAIDSMRPRSYYFLGIATETMKKSDTANIYFNRMLDLDSTWPGGLSIYLRFLEQHATQTFARAGITRLHSALTSLAAAPAESSTKLHTREYEALHSLAKQLLTRAEKLYSWMNQR
ncbi:MAG TPA: hypothetical protein VFO76_05090 [Candidatus Kapabacteria bacterium]|nr:hypothetical protein [Candidatus Kapabacteria bacterium]